MSESELVDRRIEIARSLFAAWSSGDPDAPEPFLMPDGMLADVASGTFEGWPAIRAFFASGLTRTGNLTLVPDEFWGNDGGLAVHYVMSGDVVRPESFGPEHVGSTLVGAVHVVPALRRGPRLLRGRLPRQGSPRQVARHRWVSVGRPSLALGAPVQIAYAVPDAVAAAARVGAPVRRRSLLRTASHRAGRRDVSRAAGCVRSHIGIRPVGLDHGRARGGPPARRQPRARHVRARASPACITWHSSSTTWTRPSATWSPPGCRSR